jgi:hypothetical protein
MRYGRPHVTVGKNMGNIHHIQEIRRGSGTAASASRMLYMNKLYSKILHPVTDEVTMLQTSNTRSYTLLRKNTRSYTMSRTSYIRSYKLSHTNYPRSHESYPTSTQVLLLVFID